MSQQPNTCPYPIGVNKETGAPILCGKPCAVQEAWARADAPASKTCVAHALAWRVLCIQRTLAARKVLHDERAAEGRRRVALGIKRHDDPQAHILTELSHYKIPRSSVAVSYAYVLVQLGDKADWDKIDQAIKQRWRSRTALARIRAEASRYVNEWQSKGRAECAREGK